jgi:hypothetical protein
MLEPRRYHYEKYPLSNKARLVLVDQLITDWNGKLKSTNYPICINKNIKGRTI